MVTCPLVDAMFVQLYVGNNAMRMPSDPFR